MDSLGWILIGGFLMSAIALIGGVTTLLKRQTLTRILLPLVALAAGTLLGGALFFMVPKGMASLAPLSAMAWLVFGFALFLALEQFLHWHHSHSDSRKQRRPVTYLILLGDATHNFIGGLAIASTFLISPPAGVMAWIAGAAHEIPQELGDFGILVHGGWPRSRALFWNVVCALTFPLGALVAYFSAQTFDIAILALIGAGNFIYIASSDLIPEIKATTDWRVGVINYSCFALGLVLMFALAWLFRH